MTREELEQWILRQLGAPVFTVHLTCDMLDDSIEEARRWFSAKKGFKRQLVMFAESNRTEYELPCDVDTVIDVAFSSRPTDFSRVIDPLGLLDASIPYNLFPHPQAGGLFSTYAQALQYIELSKRITGGEVEWRQDGRTLFIFPIPKESGNFLIDYKSNTFTIEQLNERDHDLVKRYSLAWAKTLLARIWTKYGSYPGAQGTVSLNGPSLLQEGQQELKDLTEELANSGFPMGFLAG
jgi:hypothetical protein